MKKTFVSALCLSSSLLWHGTSSAASQVEIQVEVPAIQTAQYHRPYVAIWVENAQQESVKLLAVWRKEPDWLKDLRRFWRKIGRINTELADAMTGATKRPGTYTLEWDGKDDSGNDLPAGTYTLLAEAAREQGGRSLIRQEFVLPAKGKTIESGAETELGPVKISFR